MKTSLAAIMVLALPMSELAAQQPPAAPQANPITAAFRGRLATLHRNLAQAFDSIPAAKFTYRPTAAQQTIGFIAQHLVNDNYLFCDRFGAMKGTRSTADTTTADSVKAAWPKDSLVAKLKDSFKFCEDAFAQLDDAKLAEQVTMCGYCEPGFIMAIAALLEANPSPSEEQVAALPNLCRCGAYPRIRKAIARAAATAAATAANSVPQPKQSFSGTSSQEEQQAP